MVNLLHEKGSYTYTILSNVCTVLITKSTIDLLHRCNYGTLTHVLRNFSDSLFNIIIIHTIENFAK